MAQRRFLDSLNAAAEGFIYVVKTERNMRIHFLFGVLVLILGIYFDFSKTEFLLVCIAGTMVLVSEMINTSIELTVDMVKEEYHPLARIIKDVSAGAVFISACNAMIVGFMLFSRHFRIRLDEGIFRIRQSEWYITFIVLIIVFALVVTGKSISKKGTPFQGGMPSGHAAFAFSVWTIIAFISESNLVTIFTFIMAFLIARHRIIMKIHTIWEVITGALLGILSTAVIFQILK